MAIFKTKKNNDVSSVFDFSEEEKSSYETICKDGVINSDKIILKDLSGNVKEITITEDEAKQLNSEVEDYETYQRWIKNQDFGSYGDKIKPVLEKLLKTTQTIGNTILRIGKVLVDIFIKIVKYITENFKNTIFGIVAGFVLGLLICNLPVIGWLLGGIIMPLCVIGCGVIGFKSDMQKKFNDPELSEKIENTFNTVISGLGKGISAAASGISNLIGSGIKLAMA